MQKVIGIGETILDIIFKDNRPIAAVPGGSVFNGVVSLARMGVQSLFISETGNDRVGQMITRFMQENGLSTRHLNIFPDGKSPVSLAFLDEQHDAHYIFYKDYPHNRLDIDFSTISIEPDDVVMFGSYYALNPVLRPRVSEFLEYARSRGAILYYDINFRSSHKNEIVKLTPTIIENFEMADIIRGSRDDFAVLYGMDDADSIFKGKIGFYCPRFIFTRGGESVQLRTKSFSRDYDVPAVQVESSVGAGDNFNAGVVYGLLREGVTRDALGTLTPQEWDKMMQHGIAFSTQSCRSLSNSVSPEWAAAYAAGAQ